MEPPFLVLRDGKKILAHVPFALLCQLQRSARRLMHQALVSGDPASKAQVEQIFASLQPSDGRAIIMMMVMEDACAEAEETRTAMQAMRAQQQAQQQAQQAQQAQQKPAADAKAGGAAPPARPQSEEEKYFCVHGCPVGVPCEMCEALEKRAAQGRAA